MARFISGSDEPQGGGEPGLLRTGRRKNLEGRLRLKTACRGGETGGGSVSDPWGKKVREGRMASGKFGGNSLKKFPLIDA